jgi:hypothetical protein
MSLRYLPVLETLVPVPAAWGLMAGVWLALFVPVIGIVVPPLRARFRSREA